MASGVAVGCAATRGFAAMTDPNRGLYDHQYEEFLARRDEAKGYEFQHPPVGNVPPPTVTFPKPLRWWSWDRWKRRKQILDVRDRRVREIVQLRTPIPPHKHI